MRMYTIYIMPHNFMLPFTKDITHIVKRAGTQCTINSDGHECMLAGFTTVMVTACTQTIILYYDELSVRPERAKTLSIPCSNPAVSTLCSADQNSQYECNIYWMVIYGLEECCSLYCNVSQLLLYASQKSKEISHTQIKIWNYREHNKSTQAS